MLFFSALGAAHPIFPMERESAKVVNFYGCQGRGAEGDYCKNLAGRPGFEPGYTESESVVLPLNDPPAVSIGSSVQSNETSHMERIELRTHRDHDTINRALFEATITKDAHYQQKNFTSSLSEMRQGGTCILPERFSTPGSFFDLSDEIIIESFKYLI